jgi:Tfp pilus assembly protein PilX
MNPNRRHRLRPGPPRGAATLIVVMLLFFIVSLVAAYAARNLIFEQKTSTNQYRATQALEAAEAGLEWALAMLNGSRIDASCTPLVPPDVSQNSFRQRYLAIDIDGNVTPRLWAGAGTPRERPSCVQSGAGWSCSCPSGAAPTPTLPGGGGVNPAFRVCFEALTPAQPGVVRVVSTGRTAFVDQSCDTPVEGMAGEAAASVSVVVALSSALAAPPSAALTAGRNATLTGTTVTLVNTDPLTNGVTTPVGGGLGVTSTTFTRHSLPGTPGERSSIVDTQLGSLSVADLFKSHMRMPLAAYKGQPASVVVDCSTDCANRLTNAVRGNRGASSGSTPA